MAKKKAYHHGNLREALLEAAIAIIDEEGTAGLTIRHLADRVGVSHAAPGYHFRDKSALLVAVASEGFRRLGEYFQKSLSGVVSADPAERVRLLGHAYIDFALAHRAHYRVMFGPDLMGMKIDDPEFTAVASGAFGFLHDTMREIYPDFDETDPAASPDDDGMNSLTAALSAWSTVHGIVMLWIDGTLRCQFEDWTDDTYRAIGRSIADNLAVVYRRAQDRLARK
ncbi:MAG: TetR/AcrR family transcriptional regulator [Spirochaetota bacterium]